MCPEYDDEFLQVKKCALIAIDEIIKSNDLAEYSELKTDLDAKTIEFTFDFFYININILKKYSQFIPI